MKTKKHKSDASSEAAPKKKVKTIDAPATEGKDKKKVKVAPKEGFFARKYTYPKEIAGDKAAEKKYRAAQRRLAKGGDAKPKAKDDAAPKKKGKTVEAPVVETPKKKKKVKK